MNEHECLRFNARAPSGPVTQHDSQMQRRCTWVIKVELALERLSLLFRGQGPVEAVLAEDGHLPLVVVDLVLAQQLHDLTAHRRLNTNKESETCDPRYTI